MSRLSSAADRLESRIRYAGEKGERPKVGAVFRRKLASDDESISAVIELEPTAIEDADVI